jgi:hypothetical protein
MEKNIRVLNEDWFELLVDDVKSELVEGISTSRMTLIETWFNVGKRILDENQNFERSEVYGKQIMHTLAECTGQSERSLYYAVKFAGMFDNFSDAISTLPEGKNISWSKIVKNVLTDGKEPEECKHEVTEMVKRCVKCKKIIDG